MPASVPFWSVMIPVRSPDPKYFRQTLESVLAQKRQPEEMQIEVVDDASPSGDVERLIREIGADRVQYHRHPENLGLCGNWNACIERAHGDWIHILHQDDLVRPGFYERMKSLALAHPQAGAGFCRHAFIDAEGNRTSLSDLERDTSGLLENWIERLGEVQRIQCASIVVKRSTYESLGGYYSGLAHALDWEMWMRIASRFSMFFEPQVLACFRQHPGSTTTRQSRTAENIRDVIKAIRYCRRYLPPEKSEAISKKALERYGRGALWVAAETFSRGEIEACKAQIRAALECSKSPFVLRHSLCLYARVQFKAARNRAFANGGSKE